MLAAAVDRRCHLVHLGANKCEPAARHGSRCNALQLLKWLASHAIVLQPSATRPIVQLTNMADTAVRWSMWLLLTRLRVPAAPLEWLMQGQVKSKLHRGIQPLYAWLYAWLVAHNLRPISLSENFDCVRLGPCRLVPVVCGASGPKAQSRDCNLQH